MPTKIGGYVTPDPIGPLKGSNSGSVAPDKTPADGAGAAAAATQTGDHVTLTASARSLQKLSDTIAQTPVVNAGKVAAIKQAVDGGTYKIDAASVANKLLQFESGLKSGS